MARLVSLEGPLTGQSFPIDPGLTLGREKHNDIAMPTNRHASRDHAKVWQEGPQRYAAADLGSTNGTLVNDARITRQALKDGDVLRIGDAVFRFELDPEDRPKPKVHEHEGRQDLASVLKGEAGPRPQRDAAPGETMGSIEIKQRVLQYQKKRASSNVTSWDLDQMAGLKKWGLIVAALAIAAGIFYLAMNLASGGGDERPIVVEELE